MLTDFSWLVSIPPYLMECKLKYLLGKLIEGLGYLIDTCLKLA